MQAATRSPAARLQASPDSIGQGAERALWFLGPLPPPVTGMTLLTSSILAALEKAGSVRSFNWSAGAARRTVWTRLRRNLRILMSVALLLMRGRIQNERLYLVANSFSGLYSTALAVFVASRLGYKIYLHHHVYYYIDDCDRRMAWIVRQMGPRDVHVVHCEKMIADFRDRYSSTSGFELVYPSIVVNDFATSRESAGRPLRLGLLSNLSAAKGLKDALDTFALLADRGRNVTLTIAGPVADRTSKRLIEQSIANSRQCIRSVGAVYGDAKRQFFAEIDVFLFPTKSESWGLVLNEAIAAGVPAITYNRGCTAMVLGNEAGLLIDYDASFAEPAALQVEKWMDDPDSYIRSSCAAIAQASRLKEEGQRSLDSFVQQIFFSPSDGPVRRRSSQVLTGKWLQAGLSHRNGFVRKGAAAALRVPKWIRSKRATRDDFVDQPPVLANSFPKSGTHLLAQIINALPARHNYGAFLASQTSSFQFRERGAEDTCRFIRGFVPGEVIRGHLYYEPEYADALTKQNTVHCFVYRDPRAVVVSEAHYLREMNRWHRLAPYFRRAASLADAITLSIAGLDPPVPGIVYPNIAARFARYHGWLSHDDCLAIRYEDLVSDARATVIRGIAELYARHCGGNIDIDACVHDMTAAIAPEKSHTFRSGKKSGWRSEFTSEHRRLFDEVAGDLLIELGYERDRCWVDESMAMAE